MVSAFSLTSFDASQVGACGLDLATDATYSPMSNEDEDEDEADLDYRLDSKIATGSIYVPTSA